MKVRRREVAAEAHERQEWHKGPQVSETTDLSGTTVHSRCSTVPVLLPSALRETAFRAPTFRNFHTGGFQQCRPSPHYKLRTFAWVSLWDSSLQISVWTQRKPRRNLWSSDSNKQAPPGQMPGQVLWEPDVTLQQSLPPHEAAWWSPMPGSSEQSTEMIDILPGVTQRAGDIDLWCCHPALPQQERTSWMR